MTRLILDYRMHPDLTPVELIRIALDKHGGVRGAPPLNEWAIPAERGCASG